MPRAAVDDAELVAVLRAALPDIIAIYRFGSTVSGPTHADSDVDVAVLTAGRMNAVARFELQERLARALRRPVDVVDLAAASTVMASQIVTTGTLVYEGDSATRGAFEDRVYSAYARLNEERRGILERIAAEGRVYG